MGKNDMARVLNEMNRTLVKANREARKAEFVSNEKMKAIGRLANAYAKLLRLGGVVEKKETSIDPFEHGDPDYYERMASS